LNITLSSSVKIFKQPVSFLSLTIPNGSFNSLHRVYLVRLEMQGVTGLLEPRENREPWAPQALEEGPVQQGQMDNQVTKEMLAQPAGAESMDDKAIRVTR